MPDKLYVITIRSDDFTDEFVISNEMIKEATDGLIGKIMEGKLRNLKFRQDRQNIVDFEKDQHA